MNSDEREIGTEEERLQITNRRTNKDVIIYWNNEWEEFICRLFILGKKIRWEEKDASYHTTDFKDALGTALLMVGVEINIFNMEEE